MLIQLSRPARSSRVANSASAPTVTRWLAGINLQHIKRRRREPTRGPARWPTVKLEMPSWRPIAPAHWRRQARPGDLEHRFTLLFEVGREELLVVAAGNRADLLRIGLLGQRKSVLARSLACLGDFRSRLPSGKSVVRELSLCKAKEKMSPDPWRDLPGASKSNGRARGRTRSAHQWPVSDAASPTMLRAVFKLIKLEVVVTQ